MMAHMNTPKMRYDVNFVRSAMAPEVMVTAVAANTAWKKKNVPWDKLMTPLPPMALMSRSFMKKAPPSVPKKSLPLLNARA